MPDACLGIGFAAFWSLGTAARAGVGIFLKDAFLKQFGCGQPAWEEVTPGRLARLRLRGPHGNLDVIVGYFATGARRLMQAPW